MIAIILLVAGLAFAFYAAMKYSTTPVGDSIPKRVWGSVVAAAGAIGAAAMAWVHHMTAPPT